LVKKDLKINIKNAQIAQALQLDKLKKKLSDKKAGTKAQGKPPKTDKNKEISEEENRLKGKENKSEPEEAPRRKARSRSVFAETKREVKEEPKETEKKTAEPKVVDEAPAVDIEQQKPALPDVKPEPSPSMEEETVVLGPTGKHINDLLTPKSKPQPKAKAPSPISERKSKASPEKKEASQEKHKASKEESKSPAETTSTSEKKRAKAKFKEFRDLKPAKKEQKGRFDSRDRQGLRSGDEDQRWRKKKTQKTAKDVSYDDLTVRPKALKIRVPISVKDLASEMKIKSSEMIQKLFLQGVVVTINDLLDDETTIQLIGHEFDCEISIDTSAEERIRITDRTIKEEIADTDPSKLKSRAPVVTFMGHVDHGKTSLIDTIRSSSIAAGEAGAITQHIGAFLCQTAVGPIAILDTPGHEAFSEMRARGADVTDIVVLVIAGDEGMRPQTIEALNHAKAAGVTIIVAVNKCDKPNFDIENVHRQLSEHELLPEAWGGQTITIRCSAATGEGIKELLEMLALQAEVLELQANPEARARGSVLESELHKGMGCIATVLVQNGTLKIGDPLVFAGHWGRVKTMDDEFGHHLEVAPPSTPVAITGLSGLPGAGDEFIVVASEKDARDIAGVRMVEFRQTRLQSKKKSIESLFQQASDQKKKMLRLVLRADMHGSLEALKAALMKIESEKVELDIISTGVGEISESDALLAAASNAMIVGFHTQIESHAEALMKQHGVHYSLHNVIYHAIDNIKELMTGLLDKVTQENEKGKAEVRATFKASQLGTIAGCFVIEGSIHRNHQIRVLREDKVIWKGSINSLKRVQEDVREVQKGVECGILLSNYNDIQVGDILEAFEVTYVSQEL